MVHEKDVWPGREPERTAGSGPNKKERDMEEKEIRSLSENDITPEPGEEGSIPETEPGEEGTIPGTEPGGSEEGKDPVMDPETPREDEGQDQGEKTEPPAGEQGGGNAQGEGTFQEIIEDLRETLGQKESDVETLSEAVRSLVDAMTLEAGSEDTAPIDLPFDGWREWQYPVRVELAVLPRGRDTWLEMSETKQTPDDLLARYNEMLDIYNAGLSTDFTFRYIYEGVDSEGNGTLVYDYEAGKEPEEPGPEPGQDDTVELLLSHLEDINTTLEGIVQADLEYYQTVAEYEKTMLDLQTADTGATIILCLAMFAVLGEIIMKHFLEGIR